MWQDFAISVVQVVFAVALVPTLLDKVHKPAVSTSLLNGFGMMTITIAYISLHLWWSGAVSSIVCVQWWLLATQRYRLDRLAGTLVTIPFGKLMNQIFKRN